MVLVPAHLSFIRGSTVWCSAHLSFIRGSTVWCWYQLTCPLSEVPLYGTSSPVLYQRFHCMVPAHLSFIRGSTVWYQLTCPLSEVPLYMVLVPAHLSFIRGSTVWYQLTCPLSEVPLYGVGIYQLTCPLSEVPLYGVGTSSPVWMTQRVIWFQPCCCSRCSHECTSMCLCIVQVCACHILTIIMIMRD